MICVLSPNIFPFPPAPFRHFFRILAGGQHLLNGIKLLDVHPLLLRHK